jgi:hypothetical protein
VANLRLAVSYVEGRGLEQRTFTGQVANIIHSESVGLRSTHQLGADYRGRSAGQTLRDQSHKRARSTPAPSAPQLPEFGRVARTR